MTNQFATPKPQQMILVKITGREAHLIKMLREMDFGKIVVQKMNGQLVRVEPTNSMLLDEQEGLTLLGDKSLELKT